MIDNTKIKQGKYNLKEIINLFGTKAQKKKFQEDETDFIKKNYIKNLLNTAERYCKIKKNDDNTFYITYVYEYPIPTQFKKMNTSLYQYIVPLLLSKLIDGHDENNKITLTLGKWAREIKMINDNYSLVKNNKSETSNIIGFDINGIYDFYDKADDTLERYIINSLDYLKGTGNIIWRDVYYIIYEVTDNKTIIDMDGNITTNIKFNVHLASDEEMEFYSKCVKIADEEANIQNASERYYSNKSANWNRVLKRELYTQKVKLVYKAYQAYHVHLDRCEALLKLFGKKSEKTLSKKLAKEFTNLMLENAENRYIKHPLNYKKCETKEEYLELFEGLCDMVINPKTEYLGDRIVPRDLQNKLNYKLQVEKE